jgi:hypothetical protein
MHSEIFIAAKNENINSFKELQQLKNIGNCYYSGQKRNVRLYFRKRSVDVYHGELALSSRNTRFAF